MRAVLRDAVAVAVVAGLSLQALRHWVGDRYRVPSGSMQPTLFGTADNGDIVFVDKVGSAATLRRYDLGVFRVPGESGELVKRVVAFGDDPTACQLELRDGDLWLGPTAQRLQRVVKEPLSCRDLRVPWWTWPGAADPRQGLMSHPASAAASGLALPTFESVAAARRACGEDVRQAQARDQAEHGNASGGGWLATLRAVDATYLDIHGHRGTEGENVLVDDVGVDVTFDPSGVAALLGGLDLRPDAWTFHWQPDRGAIELWRNGDTVASRQLPPLATGVGPGGSTAARPVRVEYGFLDGRFFFAVDGRDDQLWTEARRAEWVVADAGPMAWSLPRTRLFLAVVGGHAAPVERLQVFHDIHWFRPNVEIGVDPARFSPVHYVPAGCVYLLGDNGVDSRDSRMFGPVPMQGFVGRPQLVFGPWPRWRWLGR